MENIEQQKNAVQGQGCGCGCASSEQTAEKAEAVKPVARRSYLPAVDIVDNESETVLLLDMPGVAESDVEIVVEKNILSIKASQGDLRFDGYDLVYSEYGIGDYYRSFSLAESVDRDGIAASMKNGVLRVKLPKSVPVTKKIQVGAN